MGSNLVFEGEERRLSQTLTMILLKGISNCADWGRGRAGRGWVAGWLVRCI